MASKARAHKSEGKTLSERAFTRLVVEELKPYGESEVRKGAVGVTFIPSRGKCKAAPLWLNFKGAYTSFLSESLGPEEFVGAFVESLLNHLEEPPFIAFKAAQKHILPMLVRTEYLTEDSDAAFFPVWEEFEKGLCVVFAIDAPHSSARDIITGDVLGKWRMSEDALSDLAFKNLVQFGEVDLAEIPVGSEGAFYVLESRDDYNATRALSPYIQHFISGIVKGSYLAAIPSSECLIAIPWALRQNKKILSEVRKVIKSALRSPGALMDGFIRFDPPVPKQQRTSRKG